DQGWPLADRGLVFAQDTRVEKADSISSALMIGLRREKKLIRDIYQNLLAMAKGQVSFQKNASGPLTIAVVSYDIAGGSMDRPVLFLGMISVSLAVINFLPIPVLDGGHMVFLIYERLRGRPMPEQLRFAATFLGLVLIGSLMLFVIYLDVKRWLFRGRSIPSHLDASLRADPPARSLASRWNGSAPRALGFEHTRLLQDRPQLVPHLFGRRRGRAGPP